MSGYPYSAPLPPPATRPRAKTLDSPELMLERSRYLATYRFQVALAIISAIVGLAAWASTW